MSIKSKQTTTKGQCEICKKITKYVCEFCGELFYCSPLHLNEHWPEHSKNCKRINVNRVTIGIEHDDDDDEEQASVKKVEENRGERTTRIPIKDPTISKRDTKGIKNQEEMLLYAVDKELEDEAHHNMEDFEKKIKRDGGFCLSDDATRQVREILEKVNFGSITADEWEILSMNPELGDAIKTLEGLQIRLREKHCRHLLDPKITSGILYKISQKEKTTQAKLLKDWHFIEVFGGFVVLYKAFAHISFVSDPQSEEELVSFSNFAKETYNTFVQYIEYICPYLQCLHDFLDDEKQRRECIDKYVKEMASIRKKLDHSLLTYRQRIWKESKSGIKAVISAITIAIKWTCKGAMLISEVAANASGARLVVGGGDPLFTKELSTAVLALQAHGIPVWTSLSELMPGSKYSVFGFDVIGWAASFYNRHYVQPIVSSYSEWFAKPALSLVSGTANSMLVITWNTMKIVNKIYNAMMLATTFVCDQIITAIFPQYAFVVPTIAPYVSWVILACVTAFLYKSDYGALITNVVYRSIKSGTRKVKNVWIDWAANKELKKTLQDAMEIYIRFLDQSEFIPILVTDIQEHDTDDVI